MQKAIILATALAGSIGLAACAPAETNTAVEEAQDSGALAVVQGFYEAIGTGDMDTVAGLLAEDVAWSEAEGSPYAAGNPYVGFEAMGAGVFGPINEAFADFAGIPETFTTEGDRVVVEGRYTGTNRETGEALDAPFVHVFTVADGQIATFQQYTDTWQWRQLTGTLED
ncbi:nuclear transport factor 2 family protein [Aurantiacibacter sp. MUD11]|uniref:nuclear transport factor 2 family protein n=1 Tax=Aurantiacibacter sp. MUD11 TaxID=3003265 RepID=UPI0022AA5054|nr:nuclear transport factor 2 family protein [Aurantiacibacter sp. MUD11]WAT16784.1 nuclear transport factor 2 family protein [Aurantiacibacter sp. MUD11]